MFSCCEFPVFLWSAAFPGLAIISPQIPEGCVERFIYLRDLFIFQIYKNKKKHYGIGHMTQGDHFLWLPGHTHTLTTPPPPCLWQSQQTNNLHSWLARHPLFSLLGIFGSLFPRFLWSSALLLFFFYYYLSTDSCLLFRQMRFWENGPRHLRRPRVWQVFPVDFSCGLIVSSNPVIGNTNGADYSQKTTLI